MSVIHYKFGSSADRESVGFDGLYVSLGELKKLIMHQKKISGGDLQIIDEQTNIPYTSDAEQVPKNSSVIVRRIPPGGASVSWKEEQEARPPPKALAKPVPMERLKEIADIHKVNASEEDKIKAAMMQSTRDFDPVKLQPRPVMPNGPPQGYICKACGKNGHFIHHCPFPQTGRMDIRVKRSTGIPNVFLTRVEGPNFRGALVTPSGWAVPTIDAHCYSLGEKVEKPPFIEDNDPKKLTVGATAEVPQELLCPLCKDLLTDAVVIPCCGSSFCDDCIRTLLIESPGHECPNCQEKNQSPDKLVGNKFLRIAVSNFQKETGYTKVKMAVPNSNAKERQSPAVEPALATQLAGSGVLASASPAHRLEAGQSPQLTTTDLLPQAPTAGLHSFNSASQLISQANAVTQEIALSLEAQRLVNPVHLGAGLVGHHNIAAHVLPTPPSAMLSAAVGQSYLMAAAHPYALAPAIPVIPGPAHPPISERQFNAIKDYLTRADDRMRYPRRTDAHAQMMDDFLSTNRRTQRRRTRSRSPRGRSRSSSRSRRPGVRASRSRSKSRSVGRRSRSNSRTRMRGRRSQRSRSAGASRSRPRRHSQSVSRSHSRSASRSRNARAVPGRSRSRSDSRLRPAAVGRRSRSRSHSHSRSNRQPHASPRRSRSPLPPRRRRSASRESRRRAKRPSPADRSDRQGSSQSQRSRPESDRNARASAAAPSRSRVVSLLDLDLPGARPRIPGMNYNALHPPRDAVSRSNVSRHVIRLDQQSSGPNKILPKEVEDAQNLSQNNERNDNGPLSKSDSPSDQGSPNKLNSLPKRPASLDPDMPETQQYMKAVESLYQQNPETYGGLYNRLMAAIKVVQDSRTKEKQNGRRPAADSEAENEKQCETVNNSVQKGAAEKVELRPTQAEAADDARSHKKTEKPKLSVKPREIKTKSKSSMQIVVKRVSLTESKKPDKYMESQDGTEQAVGCLTEASESKSREPLLQLQGLAKNDTEGVRKKLERERLESKKPPKTPSELKPALLSPNATSTGKRKVLLNADFSSTSPSCNNVLSTDSLPSELPFRSASTADEPTFEPVYSDAEDIPTTQGSLSTSPSKSPKKKDKKDKSKKKKTLEKDDKKKPKKDKKKHRSKKHKKEKDSDSIVGANRPDEDNKKPLKSSEVEMVY